MGSLSPRSGDRWPIVSVVAPPGYGKTTLLAQWAERGGQSCAWVSVDETDNDPKVLLSYMAEALDAVEPIGERVFADQAKDLRAELVHVKGNSAPRASALTAAELRLLPDARHAPVSPGDRRQEDPADRQRRDHPATVKG